MRLRGQFFFWTENKTKPKLNPPLKPNQVKLERSTGSPRKQVCFSLTQETFHVYDKDKSGDMNLYELRDALTHLGNNCFMFTQLPGIFAVITTFCPELRVQFYPNGKSRGSV